jgi:putative colanic acid biosynthesis UDP-glucose lipid carrier transferase
MNFVNRSASSRESVVVGLRKTPLRRHKWAISYHSIEPVAIGLDALAIFAASILSGLGYHYLTQGTHGDVLRYIGSAAAVAILFIALAKDRDLYSPTKLLSFKTQVRNIALIWVSVLLFCAGVVFALQIGKEFSRGVTFIFAASGLVTLGGLRVFWRLFIYHGVAGSKFAGRGVVLISDQGSSGESELSTHLARHGMRLQRRFVLPAHKHDSSQLDEVISRAIAYVRGSDIEEIIVGADLDRWSELKPIMSKLRVLPLPVNLIPVGAASEILALPLRTIGDRVSIELQREPLTSTELAAKRIIDIVCAVTGLVVLLPLFLIVAAAIKLDSAGPILFRQHRCGFNGKQFRIFKFRTMTVLEDGRSIAQATPDDERFTCVGKWLRRTSIDELPQLLNVLMGTMSVVGPRPHAVAHDDHFYRIVSNYALRLDRMGTGERLSWTNPHCCGHGKTGEARYLVYRQLEHWSRYLDYFPNRFRDSARAQCVLIAAFIAMV